MLLQLLKLLPQLFYFHEILQILLLQQLNSPVGGKRVEMYPSVSSRHLNKNVLLYACVTNERASVQVTGLTFLLVAVEDYSGCCTPFFVIYFQKLLFNAPFQHTSSFGHRRDHRHGVAGNV